MISEGTSAGATTRADSAAGASRARRAVRRAPKPPEPITDHLPVARVAVDLSLPHLDRPFDYLVPESAGHTAVPGARVRVRVAGQDLLGFVLARLPSSDFGGTLQRLSKVVSAEPVLSPEIAELSARVAARYAGTRADVLRLAVPPRVAKVEQETAVAADPPPLPDADADAWAPYPDATGFLAAITRGQTARAVWTALPGSDWPAALARAAHAAASAGRGALIVVPDQTDLLRVDQALAASLGPGRHVVLNAALGPTERYRRWLTIRRGQVPVVVGTRAAMFAPVADLGLVAIWDDGDDLHAEPRAPYPHVREVLALRSASSGAALLMGGYARTAEGEQAVRSGWARPLEAPRATVRAGAPKVTVLGDDAELARDAGANARLPSAAWQAARDGLAEGPVLVSVPRAGYVPGLACADCRNRAECPDCAGALRALAPPRERAGQDWAGGPVGCARCGKQPAPWSCPHCGGRRLRAVVVGVGRTAEELGRAFPNVPVVVSAGESVTRSVRGGPALVLATPGAEPRAEGGYAAALLLDGWALLTRPDLRAAEEALRRWLNASALVRPGGRVMIAADSTAPAVQALLRWDPAGFAGRELDERAELRMSPAARVVSVEGSAAGVADLARSADLPAGVELLGPIPLPDGRVRAVLRAPLAASYALTHFLHTVTAGRSARRASDPWRVQVDPLDIG